MGSLAKGIPDGASVVMPRLYCRDVAAEIDFCKDTFLAPWKNCGGLVRKGP